MPKSLKTDSQGFLVGDPVNLIDLAEQWKLVSADTRAIRSIVSRIASILSANTANDSPTRKATHAAEPKTAVARPHRGEEKEQKERKTPQAVKHIVEVVQPKSRQAEDADSQARTLVDARRSNAIQTPSVLPVTVPPAAVVELPKGSGVQNGEKEEIAVPQRRDQKETDSKEPVAASPQNVEAVRDAKGRFVRKGGSEDDSTANGPSNARSEESLAGEAAEKIAEAVKTAGEGLGESDPAVQAMQEIAQPISTAMDFFGFGKSKEEGWLRKIFRSLKDFHKEESVFNKAQNKALKELVDKPAGGGIREAGANVLNGVKQFGMGALSIGSSLAKRIPLLGALIAGGSSLIDIFKSENDDTKTRAEKDQATGKAAGKGLGAVGGMIGGAKLGAAIGTALGPIGTAVGSIVGGAAGVFFGGSAGSIIGEQIGSFVGYLREADIPGKIMSVWTGFTDTLKSGWDSALETLSGVWDKTKETVGDAVDSANGWVKEKTGIDIIGSIKGAFSKDGVIGSKFVRPKDEDYKPARKSTDPWQLGATSELYESGNRGAGTISSGKGDHGGASYGTYQLSSKQGMVQKFISDMGYDPIFEGMEPGSEEFNKTWRTLAKYQPEFAQEQHDFVKKEYYDKAQANLKEKGIDLSNRGRAVQDAVWSTSVQFGAGGASNMMQKALKGKDIASMSDAEIVTALQDYKIENNSKLFKSSSWNVRMGTLVRAQKEKEKLLTLAKEDAAGNVQNRMPVQVATNAGSEVAAPSSTPVNVSVNSYTKSQEVLQQRTQSLAAAKNQPVARVEQPIGSLADKKPPIVNIQGEVGQDVKDRAIAHIVTGGIAV